MEASNRDVGAALWVGRSATVCVAFLLWAGLLGPLAGSEAAASTTLTPVADAHVRADTPSVNYATATSLRVDGSPISRAYLRFDLRGLAPAVKATLRLYVTSATYLPEIAVNKVADDSWREDTITYSNAPPVGGVVGSDGSFGSGEWVSVDVTPAVGTGGVVSLALTTTSETAEHVASRETSTKPRLVVQSALEPLMESVPSATGYRYGARDNLGSTLDTLKIISDPGGGYVGVYHTQVAGVFRVRVATSPNLLTWTHRADLAAHGSQPTIAALSNGGFLVAYERDFGCTGLGSGGKCLRFLYYTNRSALLSGQADRSFQAPRTLSNCAEGTPNIYSAALSPEIANSTIDVGFHYFRGCDVDRQARGTLTDFSSWSARLEPQLNLALEAFGPQGNIGDRDNLVLEGRSYNLHEVQFTKGDFGSWRTFLYDWSSSLAQALDIRTHGGSRAFANPTFTLLRAPSSKQALVVTMFIPQQGAAPGEAGELIYYRELEPAPPPPPQPEDPVIAAAGDISCAQGADGSSSCHDRATSDLLVGRGFDRVLALGDNQYESGALSAFQSYYDPTWGRVKSITLPSPGNHDQCLGSGYNEYFGKPCWYSIRLGAWRLISLDSNRASDPAQLAFLNQALQNSPRCVLAYWHHPRFSSGSVHGNQSQVAPFWALLYAAHADVVLSGHDHIYERFAPQNPAAARDGTRGIREFVVGTGGRSLYGAGTVRPNSQVRRTDTYGVLKLTLHADSYDWRFVPEAGKTFTDSGTSPCH